MKSLIFVFAGLLLAGCVSAWADEPDADPMSKLSLMHGVWEGTASGTDRDGPFDLRQTERIGPMLNGEVLVIEGRGYAEDGTLEFNAFAVVSFNSYTNKYEMRSYAQGSAGTFELVPRENGYTWTIPAGPDARIEYRADFDGNSWEQVGEYIKEGEEPRRTFDMSLTRTGGTDWPAAGAIGVEN